MKILLLHNRYQIPGGEDVVAQAEKTLLEDNGHSVAWLEVNNDDITGIWSQIKTAANTIYSYSSKKQVSEIIASFHPDIVHIHNFFPLLSPAVYDACQEAGIPVVQTLHNYRLLCPNAEFFRDGGVCEDCLGKVIPLPGVIHSCYRGNRAATAAVAAMLSFHRIRGTWRDRVNSYIALNEFAREKFIAGGLPPDKIVVKPNFLHPDPGVGTGTGGYGLFVGRISQEKGLDTLIAAWKHLGGKTPLKIVGDGPQAFRVAEVVKDLPGIELLGRLSQKEVLDLMKEALVLIFPSLWYEGFPMTIVEAYAVGVPVIASQIGSLSSLMDSYRTGIHFRPGDAEDLAAKVEWTLSHPAELSQMRRNARAEFEGKYTAKANYQKLIEIYQEMMA
ncbi:MAG TPA: glycosyl transferase family 1 [Cyanobacteria bacterium UBA11149]|nr:glycosyl transferase family 1 [Cyanobacteria bacterium UBA11367]HBE58987.1 glycosyl transferase family 1 [Cyanobacteria bacterium UBA11366]HBK63019.1 glycosyl transferase family 1 [Cyanobacteria bacterium UBA11166]HBR76758.1 glycosyl transferase family 1 [Cyanobacteria bacterium UBA11159]HBS70380.1 glycosyl transferase family 1 [Cyanobacteria bacterium UBA11153]HBW89203.1 glycosyl transferase family 1 [Cyanobacteria bacterium UBA11149]HCA97156.1 glycosyl transferase family 1 [Cyanobacteria